MTEFEYDMQNFARNIRHIMLTHIQGYDTIYKINNINHRSQYSNKRDNFVHMHELGDEGIPITNKKKKNYKANISNTMYHYHYKESRVQNQSQRSNNESKNHHVLSREINTQPQNTLRRRINAKKQEQNSSYVYNHDDIFNTASYPSIDFSLERSYIEEKTYIHQNSEQTNNQTNNQPNNRRRSQSG